jgi:outer membrane biosynthesis protein TonB
MKKFFQKLGLCFSILFLAVTFCYAQKPKQSNSESLQTEVEDVGFQCSNKEKSEEPHFETIIKVGDITKRLKEMPKPKLSSKLKAAKVFGKVIVEIIVVAQDGEILWARVKSGHPLLSEAVKDVVCQARFSSAIIEGKIIGVRGTLTYDFPRSRK